MFGLLDLYVSEINFNHYSALNIYASPQINKYLFTSYLACLTWSEGIFLWDAEFPK